MKRKDKDMANGILVFLDALGEVDKLRRFILCLNLVFQLKEVRKAFRENDWDLVSYIHKSKQRCRR